jgi:hypothetical protein
VNAWRRLRQSVVVLAAAALVAGMPATAGRRESPSRWCGTATTVDQPDAVSALQVHVVYAVPSDAPDRIGERSLPVSSDVAAIESWWQAQDHERDLRLDLLAGSCDTTAGNLDLTEIALPQEGAFYADPRQGFERIATDVEQPSLGLVSPDKKYLVYYDGPVRARGVCGTSSLGPARTTSVSVVYLDAFCGSDLGEGGKAAATAAHELLHALGARPRLHPCSGSSSHACDSASDLLYPTVEEGVTLASLRLDVGRDDYYGLPDATSEGPDTRDSPFLDRLTGARISSPPVASSLWAATVGRAVTLAWRSDGVSSGLLYRVYRDGRLLTETDTHGAHDSAAAGTTVSYSVRVADTDGYLGAARVIRVLVGLGVVDERGMVVPDTIRPLRVTGLLAQPAKSALVLRWNAVADTPDLAGYRVYRNDRVFVALCRRPVLRVGPTLVRGRWAVAAVDSSGNLGPKSKTVVVA